MTAGAGVRNRPFPLTAVLAILVGIWPASMAADDADGSVRVSAHATIVRPGDAILITASTTNPVVSVTAQAFNHSFVMWPTSETARWEGLIAVALATTPGQYDIVIRTMTRDKAGGTGRLALTVQPAHFATRRLRVAERFVNPPAGDVERILREARLLAGILAHVRPERIWAGEFVRPVPGAASSSFGRLTILNGQSRARHQGADLSAAEGTPVQAPNAGEVVLALDLYFTGTTVILDHGAGLFSLLAHLSRVDVASGQRVARGEVLGASGATGRVTGPHLHWGVKLGDVSVDPLSLMNAVGSGHG